MRILMLGNSFTATHGLPEMVAELTGAEVVTHTRGGARLAEQINPKTKMGARTLAALAEQDWNYVVMQEMSNAPARTPERFLETADKLCAIIRGAGATPVFHETWAYERDSKRLADAGFAYEEMHTLLSSAYGQAAENNNALIARVGDAFFEGADSQQLYSADSTHPNEAGARLAARVIAETILEDAGR